MPTKLFDECVAVLKADTLTQKNAAEITSKFIKLFPMTVWGKIDWSKINNKIKINSSNLILPTLEKLLDSKIDKSVYIEWSEGNLPAIQTNLENIIRNFDDVTCVAFHKFIFNFDSNYIVEILSEGQITIGLTNSEK